MRKLILSNFIKDKEINLKPCVCGNTNLVIEEDVSVGIYECSIGCLSDKCLHIITQTGHSKQVARDKAVRMWNKNDDTKIV